MIVEDTNYDIYERWHAPHDEADDSGPHGDHIYMTFGSTPNVRIYLGNEDDAKKIKKLIKLTIELNIRPKPQGEIQYKQYTLVNSNGGCYIYGINTLADIYFSGQMPVKDTDIAYIEGDEYIHVLKKIIIKLTTGRFRQLDQITGVTCSTCSESIEEPEIRANQIKLVHTLGKSPCITNEDFVRIIGRKKLRTLDAIPLLQKELGKERLASIIQLASK